LALAPSRAPQLRSQARSDKIPRRDVAAPVIRSQTYILVDDQRIDAKKDNKLEKSH